MGGMRAFLAALILLAACDKQAAQPARAVPSKSDPLDSYVRAERAPTMRDLDEAQKRSFQADQALINGMTSRMAELERRVNALEKEQRMDPIYDRQQSARSSALHTSR